MFLEVLLFGLVAGMSPGPDFFVVTRNSIAYGKRIGIASAIGVASALVFHATYSILGLTVIMVNYHFLFVLIQLSGAAYLAYLGIISVVASFQKKPTSETDSADTIGSKSLGTGFLNGLLCNLLNPKAYLFFLSIFSQFMSPTTPMWVEWIYAFEVVAVIGLWFTALAILISTKGFKSLYWKFEKWIDRTFGGVLLFFAVKISTSAITGE